MRSEIDIAYDGMSILIEKMGMVEAEKFISIIHNNSFDYTQWRQKLWAGKTVRELSREALDYRKEIK